MTQVCPKCQRPNRAEAKFCAHCRAALPGAATPPEASPAMPTPAVPASVDAIPCPQCSKLISAKAKFCNYCGQPLTGTPAPQVAAQPVPQPVPAAAPMIVPQMTSNASAPQSPPPYAPPVFTPKRSPRFQRKHKIILGVTSGIVLIVLIAAVAFVAPLIFSQPPTPAAIPSTTLPAVAPVPTSASMPTAILEVTDQSPTATPLPTPSSRKDENTFVVQNGQTLESITREHCKGIPDPKIFEYTRQIIKVHDKDWKDWPNIYPGEVLNMPPCPR